jgi:hypothetical protein
MNRRRKFNAEALYVVILNFLGHAAEKLRALAETSFHKLSADGMDNGMESGEDDDRFDNIPKHPSSRPHRLSRSDRRNRDAVRDDDMDRHKVIFRTCAAFSVL